MDLYPTRESAEENLCPGQPRAQTTIAAGLFIAGLLPGAPVAAATDSQAEYVVLAETDASSADVRNAIKAAGGTVTDTNAAIGSFTVMAPAEGFVEAVFASKSVFGASGQRAIGKLPGADPVKVSDPEVEAIHEGNPGGPRHGGSTAGMDPLDPLLWGLAMVKSDLARSVNAGDSRVLVGILDSGIDALHPDLPASLRRDFPGTSSPTSRSSTDRARSRPASIRLPWTTAATAPMSRAPSQLRRMASACPGWLPASSWSASAAARTGLPVPGPVTNALTYGADIGVDVINMSFYVDPWLYNCTANPADSPEDQLEQRTIIEAMNRALDYAHSKYVTLVGSLGNNHEDLGHPRTDFSSPDFRLARIRASDR